MAGAETHQVSEEEEGTQYFADVADLTSQPSMNSLVSGRVAMDLFEEALHTVETMGDVHSAFNAQPVKAMTYAEEALLGRVEEEQGAEPPLLRDEFSDASHLSSELALELAIGRDGELMPPPPAAQQQSQQQMPSAQGPEGGGGDGNACHGMAGEAAAPQKPALLRRSTLRTEQLRPLLPSAAAVGAAAGKAVQQSSQQQQQQRARRAGRGLGPFAACMRRGCAALSLIARRLLREGALLLCLLLPHLLAVYGHAETGQWELWLLRPLYALVLARVAVALLFGLVALPCVADNMPAHVTLVANAFAGWPAIVLAWVLSMYFFSGVLSRSGAPFADKRAWAELSANFDFLFGVRVWLFACAASRGLLELYTCGMFSRMQRGHFEERVASALLALKVFRLLFAASRASARRARQRLLSHAASRTLLANTAANSGGGRPAGSGGGGRALAAPDSPASRLDAQLFGGGWGGDDGGMDDGLATLREALEKGSGFVSSLGQARQIGAQSFRALLAELARASPEYANSAPQLPRAMPSEAAASPAALPRAPQVQAEARPPFAQDDGTGQPPTSITMELQKHSSRHSAAASAAASDGVAADAAVGAPISASRSAASHASGRRDGGGDDGGGGGGEGTPSHVPTTIPRDWLVKVVTSAAGPHGSAGASTHDYGSRHADARLRQQLCAKMHALFTTDPVSEAECAAAAARLALFAAVGSEARAAPSSPRRMHLLCYVAATERAYKEQRFIGASVDSYGTLHAHVTGFLVGTWAVVCGVAGVFLVEWGVDLQQWVMPFSSTVLSAALVCGWLPYETISGILYVLAVRPYDIGDRILVSDPGRPPGMGTESLIVSEINLTSTVVLCWNGEQQTLMNHITRRLVVVNLTRSGPSLITHRFELPASLPGSKVSEIVDAARVYVESQPQDWLGVASATVIETQYSRGYFVLEIYVKSAHKRCDEGPLFAAKSNLLLFVHSYLQAAGIEYARPMQPVRHVVLNNGSGGGGLADTGRALFGIPVVGSSASRG